MASPSTSLGNVQRFMKAKKAAGQTVHPWELEALYRGEQGNLAGQRNTSRSLTLQDKRDTAQLAAQAARDVEMKRMNDVNTALAKQAAAERLQMAKDEALARGELQEKALLSQAEQAELNRKQQKQQFDDNQAFLREKAKEEKERADRIEARQKEIDAFEKQRYADTTATQRAQYEQNLASQAEDRKAMQTQGMTGSLMGAGVMLGGAAIGKDGISPSKWFGGGETGAEQLSGPGSKGYSYTPEGNPSEAGYGTTSQTPQWELPEEIPNDFAMGEGNTGMNLGGEYSSQYGTDLGGTVDGNTWGSLEGYTPEQWDMPELNSGWENAGGWDNYAGGWDNYGAGLDNFGYENAGGWGDMDMGSWGDFGGDAWANFGGDFDWSSVDFSGLF